MPLRLATWNVNSLKVRLPHLLDWLARAQPDVMCLQETKTEDGGFPATALAAAGYKAVYCGQKTYNGVALLSREAIEDVQYGLPGLADDAKRLVAASVGGVRIVSIYAPNGQAPGTDKYAYKLGWFQALADWLRGELARHPRLAALGDFNVAPEDRDVHDPKRWEGQIHVSAQERAAFAGLLALGLEDAFRLFEQPAGAFSWWDYRLRAYERGWGLRIDEILLSAELARRCVSCTIDEAPRRLERPSDHAPVIAELR